MNIGRSLWRKSHRELVEGLPTAIIVDIDGTIALMDGRTPIDSRKWHEDKPHTPIISLLVALYEGLCINVIDVEDEPSIIFMTGRENGHGKEEIVWDWIEKYTPFDREYCYLYMRDEKDYRGDVDMKRDLFNRHVEGKYNVAWVFEDRNKMVNFWRNEMKIPTLQVKDGDY